MDNKLLRWFDSKDHYFPFRVISNLFLIEKYDYLVKVHVSVFHLVAVPILKNDDDETCSYNRSISPFTSFLLIIWQMFAQDLRKGTTMTEGFLNREVTVDETRIRNFAT